MNISQHPPCEPDCSRRTSDCHGTCIDYVVWRLYMDLAAIEQRKEKEAALGVNELKQDRKEWLRKLGYHNTGGMR